MWLDRHPLGHNGGPIHDPRQASRSVNPLRSFGKLKEEKPVDISQRIQREYSFRKAFHNEMKICILRGHKQGPGPGVDL